MNTHHYGYHDADVFRILPENHLRSDFRKVYKSPKECSQTEYFCYRGSLWQTREREPAPCRSEAWLNSLLPP